ncbi:DUF6884 domain-containing protein [Rhodococcoides fascians]|uniref:DUF6884 domain-containing protein n=1 Tax=Rhodococcoides fascians TaxID=1828 RepID=UPI00050C358C|nr:DUF6884 domain-containing protein [Rhodococcus fascians]
MTNAATHTLIAIPCGAAKLDSAAPARELYASSNFALTLRAAEAEAAATERDLGTPARVVILSALHGLIELDEVVAPYDVKMADAEHIAPAAVARQLDALAPAVLVSMLPGAYRAVLAEASDACAAEPEFLDVYEYSPGIGYQRGTSTALIRNA